MPTQPDPYRRAQQEQADAERLVAQRQREQDQAAKAAAKQAEAQAREARKAELSQKELEYRRQGMIPVTTADGNLHPDPLWEQKQAEKAAEAQAKAEKDALELKNKQARADLTRKGVRHSLNPVDGSPIAHETEADVAARMAQEAQKKRREIYDEKLRALGATMGDPARRRMKSTDRDKTVEEIKNITQNYALPGLQTALQERAKALNNGNDWIPWNESPTEDAQKAQQHLQRLQSLDPTNPELTDEDLALLEANDATKPHAQKIRDLRASLAKDDENQQWHDQNAAAIYNLKLKRDNPDAWLEAERQRRLRLPPEELKADLEASAADLDQRRAAIEEKATALNAQLDTWNLKLETLNSEAAQRRQQGLTAGEMVVYQLPDGTVEHWPKDLAAKREEITARAQDTQAMQQDDWARLQIEQQEHEREVQLLNEAAQHLQTRQQAQQKQQIDTGRRRLQFTPGMEQTAQELDALRSDAEMRQQALAEMYPDGVPEAAQQALQQDIDAKAQASIATGQQRIQTAVQIYADIQKQLADNPDLHASAGDLFIAARQKLMNATGLSEPEARRLLADAEALDWDQVTADEMNQGLVSESWKSGKNMTQAEDARKTRLLSNGAVIVHPSLTSEKDYQEAVQASNASPEAKQDALDRYPEIRAQQAKQTLDTIQHYQKVLGEDATWKAWETKRPKDVTPEEWALQFVEKNKTAAEGPLGTMLAKTKQFGVGLLQSVADLVGQSAALGAGILGSNRVTRGIADEELMGLSQRASNSAEALGQQKAVYGQTSDNFLTRGLFDQLPRLAGSLVPAAGGAKVAMSATRAFAATKLGARFLPSLSAAVAESASMPQMVKAVDTLRRAGMAGAATAGGAQTYAAQLGDIYTQLRKDHPEMTHAEALQQAQMPALWSGLSTSLLTLTFGSKGIERFLTRPQEAKELAAKVFTSRLQQMGLVGKEFIKGGAWETLEEAPDEAISQMLAAAATAKPGQENAAAKQALVDFLGKGLPELAVATTVLGGAGQGAAAFQDSTVLPENERNPANLPETVATAWTAIDNHQAIDAAGKVDAALTEQQQRRASLALHLAQGGELFDVDEADLNAAGWTRDGTDFKPLKDYQGPKVLDIDKGGLPVIKDSYVQALRDHGLEAVANAIPGTETATRNRYAQTTQPGQQPAGQTQPGPQQPQPGPAQGAAPDAVAGPNQSPVQNPAGQGTQPSPSGQPAPQPGNEVGGQTSASAVTEAPATVADTLANHLVQRGLPEADAKAAAAKITALPEFDGLSYEQIIAEGPKFRAALDDLGITGSLNSKDIATNPLKANPGGRLEKVKAEMEAKAAAATGGQTSASAVASAPASNLPPAVQTALDDAIPGQPSQEVFAAVKKAVQAKEMTEQQSAAIVAQQSGALDHTELRQALENKLGWNPTRANTAAALHFGDKSQSSIPLAAAKKQRQTTANNGKPSPTASDPTAGRIEIPQGSTAPAKALRKSAAWTRARLASLSRIKDPSIARTKDKAKKEARQKALNARKAWARQFLNLLENDVAAKLAGGLYDALAIGPVAVKRLGGQMTAVENIDGRITRLIDLDAMLAQFGYLGSPAQALAATNEEENVHAGQLRLEQQFPEQFGRAATIAKWRSLSREDQRSIYVAYHNSKFRQKSRKEDATLPKTALSDAQAYHLMREYERMYFQSVFRQGAVTEAVDPPAGLIGWLRDMLAALADLVRQIAGRMQPEFKQQLDQMAQAIDAHLAQVDSAAAANPDAAARPVILRDPGSIAVQAMRTGVLFEHLAKTDPALAPEPLARLFDLLTPALQSLAFQSWRSAQPRTANREQRTGNKAPKDALMRHLLADMAASDLTRRQVQNTLLGSADRADSPMASDSGAAQNNEPSPGGLTEAEASKQALDAIDDFRSEFENESAEIRREYRKDAVESGFGLTEAEVDEEIRQLGFRLKRELSDKLLSFGYRNSGATFHGSWYILGRGGNLEVSVRDHAKVLRPVDHYVMVDDALDFVQITIGLIEAVEWLAENDPKTEKAIAARAIRTGNPDIDEARNQSDVLGRGPVGTIEDAQQQSPTKGEATPPEVNSFNPSRASGGPLPSAPRAPTANSQQRTANLLTRLVSSLVSRTAPDQRTDLQRLLSAQPDAAKTALATLHVGLLKAAADLAGARFVQSLPPTTANSEQRTENTNKRLAAFASLPSELVKDRPPVTLPKLQITEAPRPGQIKPAFINEAAVEAMVQQARQRTARMAQVEEALAARDAEIEDFAKANKLDNLVTAKYRLEEQERAAAARAVVVAQNRARFFLEDNAARELELARQAGRQDATKAALLMLLGTGKIGQRRRAADWRTIGISEQRMLAALGLGVDQSAIDEGGARIYTLSRLKSALLAVEFTLAGSLEHQLALDDLAYVQSQPAKWQTAEDPAGAAYVRNDRVVIRQQALDDLALTYPHVAATIPHSEAERLLRISRRPQPATTTPAPAVAESPVSQNNLPNKNNDSRNDSRKMAGGEQPILGGGNTSPSTNNAGTEEILRIGRPATKSSNRDSASASTALPAPASQAGLPGIGSADAATGSGLSPENAGGNPAGVPTGTDNVAAWPQGMRSDGMPVVQTRDTPPQKVKLDFKIPLAKKGTSREASFPDADSLAAFQFKLDAKIMESDTATKAEKQKAQQRGLALIARLMEHTTLTSAEIEEKLKAYHDHLVEEAPKASSFSIFRPVSFRSWAKMPESKSKALPPPVGGDIISELKERFGGIGGPNESSNWDWWRDLTRDAENGPTQSKREAQTAARKGDVSDPARKRAWLLQEGIVNLSEPSSIDEAAGQLSDTEQTTEQDTRIARPWSVSSGQELGLAILDALDARMAAKNTDSVQDIEARDAAEALASAQDFAAYAAGATGQPFTTEELARELEPEDEIQIGSEWFTVQDTDPLTLDSDRFGSVTPQPGQTLNLTAGPNHLRLNNSAGNPARDALDAADDAEVIAALQEAGLLAASPRLRDAASRLVDGAVERHGITAFPQLLAHLVKRLPADAFHALKHPHLRSAWNTVMAERDLPEITPEAAQQALRPYAPHIERRFGEMPPDIARRQAALDEDDMSFPVAVPQGSADTPVRPVSTENSEPGTENKQADFWGTSFDDYRLETLPVPEGSPMTANAIKAIAPYLISGNKGDLLGRHGTFYLSLVEPATVVLDAFGGAAIYTHFLAQQGNLPAGSTWNEWEYSRSITNRQIKDAPAAVVRELISLRSAFDTAFPITDIQPTYEATMEKRRNIHAWINQTLEDYLPTQARDAMGRFPLPDTPRTAALYLFLQNNMAENRVVDFDLDAEGKPRTFTGGKLNGKDDFAFIYWDNPSNSMKHNRPSRVWSADMPALIRDASRRFTEATIRQGDGWQLAADAPAGALVFVDTSYFPTDEQTAAGAAVMNYGNTTLGDANPALWFQKFEKYLLPKGSDVRYVVTNNFNGRVVDQLEKAGWTVLRTFRGSPKKPSHEFIALSPAAVADLRLPSAPVRTYGPGGIPLGDSDGPLQTQSGGAAQNQRGLPAGEPRQTGKRDPQSGLYTPALDATLAGGPGWDRVTSARVAAELDADRRPGDDPLETSPEIDLADLEAQLQEDADRFSSPSVNEDNDVNDVSLSASNRRVEYVEPGFYSALAEAVRAKMPARATPEHILGILKNAGLKEEEMKWTGIRQWLQSQAQDGPITQDQVLAYLATEGSVKFTVTRFGNLSDRFTYRPTLRPERNGQGFDVINPAGEFVIWEPTEASAQETVADMNDGYNRVNPGGMQSTTRNTQLTLPGGTNPQEVVITWNQPRTENSEPRTNSPNLDTDRTHYGDLDALAWYRTTDRTNAAGNGLLVEEFQSKWHQMGRDKGYRDTMQTVPGVFGGTVPASPEEAAKVPDAPYRASWPLMLFKRALLDAVQSGKQWIGWTTGDTQADRYDLSKQVKRIDAKKFDQTRYEIAVLDKNDHEVRLPKEAFTAEELPEIVGKELAERIVSDLRFASPSRVVNYTGLDLRVGGQGMRKFYDDILVKEFAKYVKPWGGTVESSSITAKQRATSDSQPQGPPIGVVQMQPGTWGIEFPNGVFGQYPSQQRAQIRLQEELDNPTTPPVSPSSSLPASETPIHLIRITHQMRDSALAGQALFASQRFPLDRALTPTTLGSSAAFFRNREQRTANREPQTGQGLTALIPVTPVLISRAYQSALRGQSSQWLPIRAVWNQFHAQNPAVTPAAFMRGVKEGDDTGAVLLSPPESAATVAAAGPFKLRNASGIMSTDMMVPLASSARITEPPFSTPEAKALEETRIHAIDAYLHGKRRPIAETPPADQAGSSRAQLPALLSHLRRSQRTGGSSAPDAAARRAADRRRDKALLTDWARAAGILITDPPSRYDLDGPLDKGGSEHHVFRDQEGRWVKITRGDGTSYGYQPRDYRDEWDIAREGADAASYLEKLLLHNSIFHDDIVLHAVWADRVGNVALITSQPHYQGAYAAQETAIKPAMEAAGFIQLDPPSAYYRPADNLAVLDLHTENAITQDNGTFLRVFDNIILHPTGALRATFERLATERSPLAASDRQGGADTPVRSDLATQVAAAAAATNTNPTQPQKDAENYKTGKVDVHGLRLSIENPAGSTRSGTDATGKPWSVTLPHHYGRILGTVGRDKGHLDFFLGPNPDSQLVLIVNQRKPGNGHFDEHKVMLGFNTPAEAARGYMASYTKGWKGLQSAIPTTIPVFKHWLTTHDTTQPVTKEQIEKLAKTLPQPTSPHDKPVLLASAGRTKNPAPVSQGGEMSQSELANQPMSLLQRGRSPNQIEGSGESSLAEDVVAATGNNKPTEALPQLDSDAAAKIADWWSMTNPFTSQSQRDEISSVQRKVSGLIESIAADKAALTRSLPHSRTGYYLNHNEPINAVIVVNKAGDRIKMNAAEFVVTYQKLPDLPEGFKMGRTERGEFRVENSAGERQTSSNYTNPRTALLNFWSRRARALPPRPPQNDDYEELGLLRFLAQPQQPGHVATGLAVENLPGIDFSDGPDTRSGYMADMIKDLRKAAGDKVEIVGFQIGSATENRTVPVLGSRYDGGGETVGDTGQAARWQIETRIKKNESALSDAQAKQASLQAEQDAEKQRRAKLQQEALPAMRTFLEKLQRNGGTHDDLPQDQQWFLNGTPALQEIRSKIDKNNQLKRLANESLLSYGIHPTANKAAEVLDSRKAARAALIDQGAASNIYPQTLLDEQFQKYLNRALELLSFVTPNEINGWGEHLEKRLKLIKLGADVDIYSSEVVQERMEKQSSRLALEFLQQEASQQQEDMDALNRRWLPQWFPPNTPAQPMGTASWWQDILDQRDEEARAPARTFVAKVWRALAAHDEAFQYGRTSNASASKIAEAVSIPGKLVTAASQGDTVRFHGKNGYLDIHDADTDRPYIRSTAAESKGKKGGGGAQIYQAALDWIHNNGKRIKDDPGGLTSINAIRRTSNFASSALRHGTTKHLKPHDRQKVPWGKNAAINTAALLTKEMDNAFKAVAEARNWRYDFTRDEFIDSTGQPVGQQQIERAVLDAHPDTSGIGLATLQRAIVTASALETFQRGESEGLLSQIGSREGLPDGLTGVLYASNRLKNTTSGALIGGGIGAGAGALVAGAPGAAIGGTIGTAIGAATPNAREIAETAVALDRKLLTVPGAAQSLDLAGKAVDLTGALASKVIKGLVQAPLVPLRVNGYLADALGIQQPLATFGSNNLDKRLAAQLDKLAGPKLRSAKAAVETWLDKPDGLAPSIKGLVDQVLPTALLPREWLALHHEMQRKSAHGQETANDLIRALSGNPRLSDLAYPKEFAENPAARAQLFDAMEGRVPMATLPPEMQRLGERLRDLLRQTGSELVRQGLMNPDTFEELQSNGWMPRYTEDEARESAGSFLAAFKLGVRDLLQQRSTAYHIVDTTRKDKTGQYVTVSRDEGGKRNRWRFRDAASRDAFYHDFVRQQTLNMLQDRGDKTVADMLAPLSRSERASMRDQIKSLTVDQIANTAKLSPMLAGIVKQAKKHQYDRFLPKDPFEPAKLVKDPVYAVARYVLGQTHNAATMELLRKTAQHPEWVSDIALNGFTAIPDASRFGPLAGKHVRKDIAAQILDLVDVPNAALQFYDAILRKWKAGKLVWNPGSHIRDAVGNTMFATLAGNSLWNPGNWPYYQQAIAALRTGGKDFAELIEQQVIGGDAYTGLVKERLKGLLPDPKTIEDYDPGLVQRMLFGFGATLHGSHEFLASLRRLPDDLFKAAAYFKAKAELAEQGTENSEQRTRAAEHVRKWFPYYDRLGQSGTTRAVGRFVNPFFSFFRESTRILGTAVAERPLALTAALSFPAIVTAISAMLLGLDDDDMEEIQKDMAGKGKLFAFDTPLFSMLLPFRSAQGAVQQFDISAIMPFADLLGTRVAVTDATEDPWNRFWRGIVSGGPVLSLVDAWRHNEDAFTRRPIAEFGMTPLEKIKAYTKHAAGVALPPLAPGGTAFNTLMRAGDRATNKTLETYDPAQAFTRAVVGLNVKNATPDLYRKAHDWIIAQGGEVQEGMDYGSTTPASRARKALFAQLAQDEPNLKAIKNILGSLEKMGHPVRTEQDINKLLFYRNPLMVVGGIKRKGISAQDAQSMFRASLTGEARAAFENALQEFQRIKQRAPLLVRQAASL
jgi:hypothetical protein